jgi:glutamine amidotransferase
MGTTISILEYWLGNFATIIRMIEKVGGTATRISTPDELLRADNLILPGVGHFDHGMMHIAERVVQAPLRERVIVQRLPNLGICLGMQLLCTAGKEGVLSGLSFVPAEVRKFQTQRGGT